MFYVLVTVSLFRIFLVRSVPRKGPDGKVHRLDLAELGPSGVNGFRQRNLKGDSCSNQGLGSRPYSDIHPPETQDVSYLFSILSTLWSGRVKDLVA